MPEGYENRRVGNNWGAFHRSLPRSLRVFNRRWRSLHAPIQITKADGGWSTDLTAADARRRIHDQMVNNPEVGARVRVRGTPATQDQYVLRRFFRSLGPDVLQAALSQLGVLYVWGAENEVGPGGGSGAAFDCSGFTKWCVAQMGFDVPHNAEAQRLATRPITWAQARPGDFVFYGEGGNPYGPAAHVGFKYDEARIIDTASAAHPVSIRSYLDVWIGKPPFVCGYIEALTGPH